jgi:uncharacterized protein YjbI with pentapeptide repeats
MVSEEYIRRREYASHVRDLWRSNTPRVTANVEHIELLKQGPEIWNRWRKENPDEKPNLSCADLSGTDLSSDGIIGPNLKEADLYGANLIFANLNSARLKNAYLLNAKLVGADLRSANLTGANLSLVDLRWAYLNGASLTGANLHRAGLEDANLSGADLRGANLEGASLRNANLSGANLELAQLSNTTLDGAILRNCRVYGISAWGIKGEPRDQSDLFLSHFDEAFWLGTPDITVDNLEVAQFIHILLNSEKIRNVIDTITTKAVLILGRFTDERKAVLDAIREELKRRDYLPILFDFKKPAHRDLAETISTLAHMSRFIIADITYAKSIPAELQSIVPNLPSVAVQPIMLSSDYEYALFEHIKRYPSVLDVYIYDDQKMLLSNLKEKVIDPAEKKAKELTKST